MTVVFAEPAPKSAAPARWAAPASAGLRGWWTPLAATPAPAGHDLSRLRILDGNRDSAPKGVQKAASCSPTWFGSTDPDVDQPTGKFTGKLTTRLNDAVLKDPCVRECVQEHEDVHVARLTPIVERIHRCDVAAGDDPDKSGVCNAMATKALFEEHAPGECAAYRRSFTCLTLKLLDPANPCSKGASREEIQKHRGYESCELRNYCTEAGTPALGVPNA